MVKLLEVFYCKLETTKAVKPSLVIIKFAESSTERNNSELVIRVFSGLDHSRR